MKTRSGIGRLGSVATLFVFLLLACSTQSPPPSSGTPSASTKPYGSVVVAWSAPLGSPDPIIFDGQAIYSGLMVGVYESLTGLDNNGNMAPWLAERWEIADDGLSQTFYLRKGVKFHDGSDLTAADVKFTMERLLGPGVTSLYGGTPAWRTMAPQVEAKDDYTVVVRFKTPQFEVAKAIADYNGSLAVLPKKYIEEKGVDYFRKNPIGSGPWKIVSWVQGQRIELEANEGYRDKSLIPKFKNLTILNVPDEAARVAMIRTGEADLADVSAESTVALKKAGTRILAWDAGAQASFMPLYDIKNPSQYAYSDVRARKALSLALNRQEMSDKLFYGYAEPGIVVRAQRTFDFFDATQLKADPYDPEGAKKLLAEAGYPNGFDTKVWDQGAGTMLSTFAQVLPGYWRKVGINATTEPIENAQLVSMILSYSNPRVWNSIFTTGLGTSTSSVFGFDIGTSVHSKVGFFRNHTNTKLDDLIDSYPKTKDPAERLKIAREALIMTKNNYSSISTLIVQATWALGSKIGDVTPIQGWSTLGKAYLTMTHAK